jgi:NAD(P)-dependent dehydrogenase (short-subunit alcohol dehydrogenase family)
MTTSPRALVTGASSGIGRATALHLAANGWHVAAVARNTERLAELVAGSDGRIVAIEVDLASAHGPHEVAERSAAALGGIDALVNAAGIIDSGAIGDVDVERFDAVMHLNVSAVYALTRAVMPSLRASTRPGAIVNISSVAGLRPFPNLAAYCVSKAALDQLTRCLAIELAPEKIRVNAVNPGVVVTELHRRGGMSDEAYSAFLERGRSTHPLGRVGTPEEVAGLVAWLLSSEASWMTGETIAIDGGRHLTALR